MQAGGPTPPAETPRKEKITGRPPPRKASELLSFIRPAYIILKPSLCGGFSGAEQWIDAAMTLGIGHWATSALESNVGLNAIAQWTARNGIPSMPQGLGTGALYLDNLSAGLRLDGEMLHCVPAGPWESPFVK